MAKYVHKIADNSIRVVLGNLLIYYLHSLWT